jgi:hypothetical protein
MINSKEFKKLYKKTSKDEKVVEISDATGFSIIRNYDEDTEYFKDNNKMLIRLYIRDGFINGGIDMVTDKKDEFGGYLIIDKKKYKNKFTNFHFGKEENIVFDDRDNKVKIKRKGKEYKFSVNEFVDLLVKNHLSDRLFWIRKKNYLKRLLLKFIFFLMDSGYSFLDYHDEIHRILYDNRVDNKRDLKKSEIPTIKEPFFNYFRIYKNLLFISSILLLSLLLLIKYFFLLKDEELNASNPILIFSLVVILFLLHYFSEFLSRKKNDKNGFIYKLHNSSLDNRFQLKLK